MLAPALRAALTRRGGSTAHPAPVSIPPSLIPQGLPFRTARGGFGFHTRRIQDAWCAMADHGCDRLRCIMIVRTKVRV